MTPQEASWIVQQTEQRYGLPPGLLNSVWQQESGGSTDLNLKGPELSRGRGRAVGPFQIVPYYHPSATLSSFAAQADYAGKLLSEGGVRKYYGAGVAPAGHPTTDQYEQQVMSRLAGGTTIPVSDIAPGPAYEGGSIMPVSAFPNQQLPPMMGALPPGLSAPGAPPPHPGLAAMALGDIIAGVGGGAQTGALRQVMSQMAPPSQQEWIRNALHSRQLDQQRARDLGMTKMGPYESRRMDYLDEQNRINALKLEHERAKLRQQASGNRGDIQDYELRDSQGKIVGYESRAPGDPFAAVPEGVGRYKISTFKGKGTGSMEGKANTALQLIDQLETLAFGEIDPETNEFIGAPGIFSGKSGGVVGLAAGAGETASQWLSQDDPRYKVYMDFTKGAMAPIVKGLGDSGNIGQKEQERALKMLPDPWTDSEPVARRKIEMLKKTLKSWITGRKSDA